MSKPGVNLKRFFAPPSEAPWWRHWLPYLSIVAVVILFFVVTTIGWDYTNANSFCGTLCHTMPPQYTTYLRSSHSRVTCVECHLGRADIVTQFFRKIVHVKLLYKLITNTYEYPIIAKEMRPANEACETCHTPKKFSEDTFREIRQFASDESNSSINTFIILKTGGGTQREGLGRGIHWHMENEVTYYATDDLQQNIPYVKVKTIDGKVTEYFDIA